YLAVVGAIYAALWASQAPAVVNATIWLLVALLIGFEAASLRRWTMRRWRERGIVVAPNLEMAERRFFETWPLRRSEPGAAATPPAAHAHVPTSDADVIGLFPEPQTRQ